MTRILCLWLPNWPIQRFTAAGPSLAAGRWCSQRRGRAAAAWRRVAARGVAQESASTCRSPRRSRWPRSGGRALRPERPIASAAGSPACERFSPAVALEEGREPESLLLDVTNLAHLLGTRAESSRRGGAVFRRGGYRVQLAVADTVGRPGRWRTRGTIANCRMKIVGQELHSTSRTRGGTNLKLRLPVESLRIADDTVVLLHQLGIETVGQLLALPREELASRFGEQLLLRLDQLTGAAPEVLVPHRAPAALEVVVRWSSHGRPGRARAGAGAACGAIGVASGGPRPGGGAPGVRLKYVGANRSCCGSAWCSRRRSPGN